MNAVPVQASLLATFDQERPERKELDDSYTYIFLQFN